MRYRQFTRVIYLFAIGLILYSFKKYNLESESYSLSNQIELERKDEVISFELARVLDQLKLSEDRLFLSIPFQIVDSNFDGENDQLIILQDFKEKEDKEFNFSDYLVDHKVNFQKRTQAEISHKIDGLWEGRKYKGGVFRNVDALIVPKEHTDHSWFIRYEGPGWESDKVGYRFYLDWRNATDIFGKKTNEMVLQDIGLDGFDSYHEPAEWGMDVLKVGASLGIGSIGKWVDGVANRIANTSGLACKIRADGDLFSVIETNYSDWAIGDDTLDLHSYISITAGSRMTHQEIELSKSVDNLCTGIVKHPDGDLIMSTESDGVWGYIATYGRQSLNEDLLGMAVIYKVKDLVEVVEDENSHVVILSPTEKRLDYYYLAAWEGEKGGIKSKLEFEQYLKDEINKLASPIHVSPRI